MDFGRFWPALWAPHCSQIRRKLLTIFKPSVIATNVDGGGESEPNVGQNFDHFTAAFQPNFRLHHSEPYVGHLTATELCFCVVDVSIRTEPFHIH